MSTVTLQPLVADHATIPHVIAMDFPFHIRYGSLICYKKLQSDRLIVYSIELSRKLGVSAYQLAVSLELRS